MAWFLQYDAGGLRAAPGLVNDVAYDASGRPLSAELANGATNTWAYHARGWTEHVRTTTDVKSPEPARTWTYEYDPLGRLVTVTARWRRSIRRSRTTAWAT